MNIHQLVTMANDICTFFDTEVGAEAPKSIATHISRFWEPRMREQIIAHVATGGAGLKPSALAAVRTLPAPPSRCAVV
ncbi:MAG: formate dehydrogenase subunit delta [Steroidobacteraceae bacterium]